MAVNQNTVKSLMRMSKNAYRKVKTIKNAATEEKHGRKSKIECLRMHVQKSK